MIQGTLALIAVLSALNSPAPPTRATIDAYGQFRELPAPATPSPSAPLSGPGALYGDRAVLIKSTDTPETCLGSMIGYHVVISGFTPGVEVQFRKVVAHPAMHMPDGAVSTGFERKQVAIARNDGTVGTFQGFGFDNPYEQVPGKWTFEFWHNDQRLASKSFSVIPCRKSKP